ncbi:MAG: class I SAM-dependent methyltransferase [Halobacteriota archaeon]
MDSQEVRREWRARSGEYSPAYYAYYGPDDKTDAVRAALDQFLAGPEPAILEVGSSSGRHLAGLLEAGYTDLTGVELNPEAKPVMEETYPELASQGTFHFEAIESVVSEFADDAFDVVYSVETLQHVHPDDDWVFEALARIAGDLIVTVENEGSADEGESVNYINDEFPLYYRDWGAIFTAFGFEQVKVEVGDRDTIRVFRAQSN